MKRMIGDEAERREKAQEELKRKENRRAVRKLRLRASSAQRFSSIRFIYRQRTPQKEEGATSETGRLPHRVTCRYVGHGNKNRPGRSTAAPNRSRIVRFRDFKHT